MVLDLPLVVGSILNGAAREILVQQGVVSCEDFASLFVRAEDLFALSADADTMERLTRAWQAARVQCKVTEERRFNATCVYPPKRTAPATLPSVLGARPKARVFAPASLQPRSFKHAMGSMQIPTKQVQGARPDQRERLLQAIFEAALACGSQNTVFAQDLLLQQDEAKPSFFRRFQAVTTERLSSLCSSMRRWVAWHARNAPGDQAFWKPSPVTMSNFFAFVSRGGPTAAPGLFHALKWWSEQVGLPLPLRHALVNHWSAPEQGYTASPRIPLPLRIMLELCKTGQKATGAIRSFVAASLLVLCACLRFRHLQRSQDLRLDSGFLRGTCRMGKRRVQKTRPPFDWAAPAVLPSGFDMASQVLLDYEELCRAHGGQPGFVLHDFQVAKGEGLTPRSKRSLRELSLARFIMLLRALLMGLTACAGSFLRPLTP